MPRSMTGYGLAEYKDLNYEITVEIRNLNNRFLDINIKLPRSLTTFEHPLKELIKKNICRGKITASITFKDLTLSNANYNINKENIHLYHAILQQIQEETGLKEPIKIEHFLQFKDLIEPDESIPPDDTSFERVSTALQIALDQMNEMRDQEGQNIGKDISKRIKHIGALLHAIEKKAKNTPRTELVKLHQRVNELLNGREVDQERIETEIAFLADKVDITEECIRLGSHIELFADVFQSEGEIGKKLNFLLQEMQRESNTIGSKTTDIKIAHQNIQIKEEIEKIREQVQNIE